MPCELSDIVTVVRHMDGTVAHQSLPTVTGYHKGQMRVASVVNMTTIWQKQTAVVLTYQGVNSDVICYER